MNCWRVGSLIAPFLENELRNSESEAIAEHLEQCESCAETVAAVAALPDLERLEIDPELERHLFESFDACLAQRIAQSLVPAERAPELAPTGTFGALIRREFKVPAALMAAYAGVVLMLGGGIALNDQRVDDLQIAVAERDAIIDAMRVRIATAESGEEDAFGSGLGGSSPPIVFLPAGAYIGTGLRAPGTSGNFISASFTPGESGLVVH
jgi:anti-sigma factor RsiW